MAKLSVLIPIYKTGAILKRTLESIKNQTFEDYECLLIDDGSYDQKTLEICKSFTALDRRFKYHCKENEGIEKTRLYAVKKASTGLLVFSDHDDFYEIDALEKLYTAYIRSDADIVIANCYRKADHFFFFKRKKNSLGINSTFIATKKEMWSKGLFMTFFGIHHFSVSTWGKLYKKQLFEKHFDLYDINILEDIVLNIQIFDGAKKFHFIDDFIYTHVGGGITSYFDIEGALIEYNKVYNFRKQFLLENNQSFTSLLIEYQNIINQRIMMMIDSGYNRRRFIEVLNKVTKKDIFTDLVNVLTPDMISENVKLMMTDPKKLYENSKKQNTIRRKLKFHLKKIYRNFF